MSRARTKMDTAYRRRRGNYLLKLGDALKEIGKAKEIDNCIVGDQICRSESYYSRATNGYHDLETFELINICELFKDFAKDSPGTCTRDELAPFRPSVTDLLLENACAR